MYSLSYKNIKPVILYILIGLFAYSLGVALLKILEERTLGSIFRYFLPTAPYLVLIFLISLYDIGKFSFSSFVPQIPANLSAQMILIRLILILLLAIPTGVCVQLYLGEGGLLVGSIAILLFLSLFFSCFYMMSEEKTIGVIIYIIAIPYLFYFQRQLRLMSLTSLVISEQIIPLSVIFLVFISFCFFLGKYHDKLIKHSDEEKNFMKLCVFFVSMPMFSIIFSKYISQSFTYYLMDLFFPIVYFFILMRSIRSIEDIKKVILALIISIFLYEFHALYFMYKQGTIEDITVQIYQSEIYTGFSPALFPLMIPFQVAMYNLLKGWKRIAIGMMLLVFIIYLFLCNYRTTIVSSFIGFILFYYFLYRSTLTKKIYISISMLLLVIISFLFIENIIEKLGYFRFIETIQTLSAGESLETVTTGRVETWRAALKMIYDHPFLGVGPDMWRRYIHLYSFPMFWYKDDYMGRWVQTYAFDPHNLYLLIWINYGLVNFLCYLAMLYIATKKALRNIKISSSNTTRYISIASFISLIFWIIMGFFTMRFFSHYTILFALIFWSIIAIIFKLNEFNSTIKDAQVVSNPINITS